jgi:hypothetical protein
MSIDREQGIYDDQKYLDAMPLMFEKVKSLNHRGINIAFWNQFECRRTLCDGKLMINNEVPIVFVHFTNKYIQELYDGNDHLIFPLLQEYEKTFAESGFQLRHFVTNLPTYNPPGTFKKVKRKLLLRTKFKNLMYRIIDKI